MSTSTYDCLDWTLTYECTVMGHLGGATAWTATIPNCQIFLDHWYFIDQHTIFGSCNARSISVQDNLYTSQLRVTVTHSSTDSNVSQFST